MAARILVLICGLAAMAMGATDPAAAADRRLNLDLDYLEARNGYVDLPEPTFPVSTGLRLYGDDGIEGLWPSIWGPVVPYAVLGSARSISPCSLKPVRSSWRRSTIS